MEENRPEQETPVQPEENRPEQENPVQPVYTPRPAWQVWAARLGLVIVIIAIILYYLHIAQGGL